MKTKSNSRRSKTGQIERQLSSSSSRVYYFAVVPTPISHYTHEPTTSTPPDNTRVDYSSHVGESLAKSTNLLTLHVPCLLEV